MATLELDAPARSRGSLFGRLAAWWDGEGDLAAPSAPAPRLGPSPEAPASTPSEHYDLRAWTPERIEAAQTLYGRGWLSPGETIHGELIKPLCLDASHSVVLHGAAAGGAARLVAEQTDAWIDALEDRPALAGEAARQIKAAGLGKKIVVHPATPAAATIKARSRHAAISFEALHRSADREATLASLRAMLRPGGQLLLTDFTLRGEAPGAASRWARCLPEEPNFATAEQLKSALERQGLEVRIFEDRSESYCRAAVGVLQALLRTVECEPVPARIRPRLVWEIEALTQHLRALEGGSLGYVRAYALAPGSRVER